MKECNKRGAFGWVVLKGKEGGREVGESTRTIYTRRTLRFNGKRHVLIERQRTTGAASKSSRGAPKSARDEFHKVPEALNRMVDPDRLLAAYETARCDLLAETESSGHWVGRLSNSALSTATAISALALVERHDPTTAGGLFADEGREAGLSELIVRGLRWLCHQQNEDGGWGDTDKSLSNIATTMLVRAAFQLTGVPADEDGVLERADAYIAAQGGVAGLRRRYGRDKTFAVPILTNCALAGLGPLEPGAGVAVRAGLFAAIAVEAAADAGRELRHPGAGGRGSGALSPPQAVEPDHASHSRFVAGRKSQRGRSAAAGQRRIFGGGAADQLRGHEPGQHRPGRASGRPAWRRFPAAIGPRRRQLADRHEPGHLEHDAGGQCAGSRRRRPQRSSVPGLAVVLPASPGPSVHGRRAGGLGLDRFERRRARRGRYVGGAAEFGRFYEIRAARASRRTAAGCGGGGAVASRFAKRATAAGPPFAAVGAACPSTAAAPI